MRDDAYYLVMAVVALTGSALLVGLILAVLAGADGSGW